MHPVTPIDSEMLARFEQGFDTRPELQVMSRLYPLSRTTSKM